MTSEAVWPSAEVWAAADLPSGRGSQQAGTICGTGEIGVSDVRCGRALRGQIKSTLRKEDNKMIKLKGARRVHFPIRPWAHKGLSACGQHPPLSHCDHSLVDG